MTLVSAAALLLAWAYRRIQEEALEAPPTAFVQHLSFALLLMLLLHLGLLLLLRLHRLLLLALLLRFLLLRDLESVRYNRPQISSLEEVPKATRQQCSLTITPLPSLLLFAWDAKPPQWYPKRRSCNQTKSQSTCGEASGRNVLSQRL